MFVHLFLVFSRPVVQARLQLIHTFSFFGLIKKLGGQLSCVTPLVPGWVDGDAPCCRTEGRLLPQPVWIFPGHPNEAPKECDCQLVILSPLPYPCYDLRHDKHAHRKDWEKLRNKSKDKNENNLHMHKHIYVQIQ